MKNQANNNKSTELQSENDKQTEQTTDGASKVLVRAWGECMLALQSINACECCAACNCVLCASNLLVSYSLPQSAANSEQECLACPSTWANKTTNAADLALRSQQLVESCRFSNHKKIKSHWQSGSLWQRGIQKLLCWQYSSKGQWRGGLLFLEAKIIAENMLAWKSVLVLLSML